MTKVKKVSGPKGPTSASVKVTGNGEVGDEAPNKPALHLMPGQGITVDMISKMYKSITGKDVTAEERADFEASLAEDHAKNEAGL